MNTPRTDAACGWPWGHHGRIESSDLRWSPDGPFVHSSVAREIERENAALRAVIFTQSLLLKRWLELADQQSETLDPMTYITFQKKDGLVGDTHSVLNTLNESKNT